MKLFNKAPWYEQYESGPLLTDIEKYLLDK